MRIEEHVRQTHTGLQGERRSPDLEIEPVFKEEGEVVQRRYVPERPGAQRLAGCVLRRSLDVEDQPSAVIGVIPPVDSGPEIGKIPPPSELDDLVGLYLQVNAERLTFYFIVGIVRRREECTQPDTGFERIGDYAAGRSDVVVQPV